MTDPAATIPTGPLLDALEVAIVVFDVEGRILLANQRAREGLAVLESTPIGSSSVFRHGLEIVDEHGERLAPAAIPMLRTLRTGETLRGFVMGARSSGFQGTNWYAVTTQAMRDDDGTITGVICSYVDTTTERRTQAALRASEERFRLIAENAADVVYRFSVGDSSRFDYVNPAVEHQLGY